MVGYSTKSVAEKLGVHPGLEAVFLNAPDTFMTILGSSVKDIHVAQSFKEGKSYDYIHLFVVSRDELEYKAKVCNEHLSSHGMLWISWPKQSSNALTDLTEQILRDVLLPLGVVDIKVCAIDEIWSGLKFMRRRQA